MRRWVFIVVLVGLGLSPVRPLVADSPGGGVKKRLAALLDNLPHGKTKVSAMVVDLTDGRMLYKRNANESLIPASNQKLLVLAAGVDFAVNGDEAFVTRLGVRGDDLVIIGDGDPGLGDRSLAESRGQQPLDFIGQWASAIKGSGINSPDELIVDVSIFDRQFVHPDWESGDLLKWYGAPIGGLNLNDNCVELTVWPATTRDAAAIWSIFPPCSLIRVTNRCRSRPNGSAKDNAPVIGRRPDSFELTLSGKVTKRGTLQSVPVYDPNRFAAYAIYEALIREGVAFRGGVRFERLRDRTGRVPASVRTIAEARTPLSDVMQRIGHDSQNMFAEALAKRLGYQLQLQQSSGNPIGSWDTARAAMGRTLRQAGVNLSKVRIADASGLSRENRLSAADVMALLRYMHHHPRREMFLSSLAGNRTGGRLQRIFASESGDIYAKTGYMSGIRSLSGLVRSADGRWYGFSIIFNDFPGRSTPYFRIQQDVARTLANLGRS